MYQPGIRLNRSIIDNNTRTCMQSVKIKITGNHSNSHILFSLLDLFVHEHTMFSCPHEPGEGCVTESNTPPPSDGDRCTSNSFISSCTLDRFTIKMIAAVTQVDPLHPCWWVVSLCPVDIHRNKEVNLLCDRIMSKLLDSMLSTYFLVSI